MNTNTCFLSTAIPYVNGSPHVGHALEFVIADAIARHRRRLGADVRFQSGTDDNSLKSSRAALSAGVTPDALVARYAAEFQHVAASLGVVFDDFVRTSADARHAPAVERLWNACARAGDIERREYRGLYCGGCEQFFSDGELAGNQCPEHAAPLEQVAETNYFFRASRYGGAIKRAIESNRLRIEPRERRREVLRFLEDGLRDFSVSRNAERAHGWGIRVPGDPKQVVYVWFDALANYISALGYATSQPTFERYWSRGDERTHVIGKGILRFHAAYWPAILLSAGLPLPSEILTHGYVTVGGIKIGKSLGNAQSVRAVVERYGADAVRYYLLRYVHTTADSDFSEERLATVHDVDLADQFGNLVRRVVTLVVREFSGRIPEPGDATASELALRAAGERARDDQFRAFARFDLNDAAAVPFELIAAANRYVDVQAPWLLCRNGDRRRLASVLYYTIEAVWRAAWLLAPIIPATTARVFSEITGCDVDAGHLDATPWDVCLQGSTASVGPPLFLKLNARK